jgi:sulfoxide reductase heme-binding subunit YedZ
MALRYTKITIFLAALIPLERLLWKAFHDGLGANPIEVITHSTGDWTLIFVLTTLSITPLRQITRQYWLIGVRRMIGLFAFFYATLHFLTYIWLDKFFDVHVIPLALTSTAWSIRRLGGRNWRRLHRLIYLTGILGVTHYTWLVKADRHKPIEYGIVLAILLSYRVVIWTYKKIYVERHPVPVRNPAVTKV